MPAILSILLFLALGFPALAQRPTIARVTQCGGFTREVKSSGANLFVAEGQNLLILTGPAARPVLTGRLGFTAEVRELEVAGNIVYAVAGGTLYIIDAGQPAAPKVLTRYAPFYVGAIACVVTGGKPCLVGNEAGTRRIQIINVANPSSPALGPALLIPGPPFRLVAGGTKVYGVYQAAAAKFVLRGMDVTVTGQGTPVLTDLGDVFTLAGSTMPVDLAYNGTFSSPLLYAAFKNQGMEIVNLAGPRSLGYFGLPNMGVNAAAGLGTRAYAGTLTGASSKEVMVLTQDRRLLGRALVNPNSIYDSECIGLAVAPGNDYAYSAAGTGGLVTVDARTAAAPLVADALVTPKTPNDIVTTGSLALVADRSAMLVIYDLAIPSAPVLKASLRPGFNGEQVAVTGHFAFVACSGNGLYVVDFSNPAQPKEIGKYQCGKRISAVVLGGRYACIYAEDEIRVLDVSNPKIPVLVGQLTLAAQGKLFANGNFALIRRSHDIAKINLTFPAKPALSTITLPTLPTDFTAGDGLVAILSNGLLYAFQMDPASGALTPKYTFLVRNSNKAQIAQRGQLVHLLVTRPDSTTQYEYWSVDISLPAAPIIENAGVVTVPPTFGYLSAKPSCLQCLDGLVLVGAVNQGMTVYDRKITLVSPNTPLAMPGGSRLDVCWRTVPDVAGSVVLFELWNSKGYAGSLGYDWNPAGAATKRLYIPPVPEGSDYVIRLISGWDNRLYVQSAAPLAITGGPVRLHAPNSGTWPLGRRQNITWECNTRFAGTVLRFELWQGGRRIKELGYGWNTSGMATTSVMVSGVAPGSYRLRAVSAFSPQYWDESNGWITIK